MSYLGLSLDSLCWELKNLIENNYGDFNKNSLNCNFENAKNDILETFKDIIEQNKEDVINELKENFEDD